MPGERTPQSAYWHKGLEERGGFGDLVWLSWAFSLFQYLEDKPFNRGSWLTYHEWKMTIGGGLVVLRESQEVVDAMASWRTMAPSEYYRDVAPTDVYRLTFTNFFFIFLKEARN